MKKFVGIFLSLVMIMSFISVVYASSEGIDNPEDTITIDVQSLEDDFVEGEEVIGDIDIYSADEEEVGLEIEDIEIVDKEEYLREQEEKHQDTGAITTGDINLVSEPKTDFVRIGLISVLIVLVIMFVYALFVGKRKSISEEDISEKVDGGENNV